MRYREANPIVSKALIDFERRRQGTGQTKILIGAFLHHLFNSGCGFDDTGKHAVKVEEFFLSRTRLGQFVDEITEEVEQIGRYPGKTYLCLSKN